MKNRLQMIEGLLESDYKGFIYINENMEISMFSHYAKKITGITLEENKLHGRGRINKGDIVIISDNELGNDDKLSDEILEKLNIHDIHIQDKDAFVAMGVYGNNKIEPRYKYVKRYNPNGILELHLDYLGMEIVSRINFSENITEIIVNGESYQMKYFESVGNMVVIDGLTGEVKFYQARGYGYRHEEIGELLNGSEFMPKHNGDEDIRLDYNEVFFDQDVRDAIAKAFKEDNGYMKKGIYEIYKRPMYCSIVRNKSKGEYDGVYISIQDVSSLEDISKERNAVIKMLEDWQEKKERMKDEEECVKHKLVSFIGKVPSMKEVMHLADRASKGNFNVVITGESGTGKTRLAREIHNMWNKDAPFVVVNCNAIAPTLIESELFGYVQGAFTGAMNKGKKGFFEEADGGTIFLDEIGDIPLDIQVKLLNVLQDKKVYPVGSTKPVDVNARVIVATNKVLEDEVEKGNFRQDLYYRIKVFPIYIPPLRERKKDLYILINSVLTSICQKYGIENKVLSENALAKMFNYSWPGNVRELENILERAVILCDSPIIYSEYILIENNEEPLTLKERLQKEEVRIIAETLLKNGNNRQKTMQELNISKTALYEKLGKYNLL